MAQTAMMVSLDKCIGCHTYSITCKQARTNRSGTECVWFSNVEIHPGLGYPREYEDQEKWQGGREVAERGKLHLKDGGRFHKLLNIFDNPRMLEISGYYEPWTYDYQDLLNAPAGRKHFPVVRAHSLITGEPMTPKWGPNWDDDLSSVVEYGHKDPMLKGVEDKVKFEFGQTFIFYLPRIYEHCLNPVCAASCPSGVVYKRVEDGIVLVDQDHCRGQRMYVSGCPYKKVYFNHHIDKAEKCTFCYPRMELGVPTICTEAYVGRLRYIGLIFYDADAVLVAAAERDKHKLYEEQFTVFLDPEGPEIRAGAEHQDVPHDWIEAARRSPVKRLIIDRRVALLLHPEYRTIPVVQYVPPLSPIVDSVASTGYGTRNIDDLFGVIDVPRIPMEYLTNLFTAGSVTPVCAAPERITAMCSYMRDISLNGVGSEGVAARVGMAGQEIQNIFRLLVIARYDERYVIPPSHKEQTHSLESISTECLVGEGGTTPGSGPVVVTISSYSAAKAQRGTVQGQGTFLG